MKLKCLAEGSTGNCWILEHKGKMLLLDVGISIKEIKKGIDYNLLGVSGIVVTHSHKDHSISVKDLRKAGLKVFAPYEDETRHIRYGAFDIQAFCVPHGNCPCFGFYIKFDGHKMVYATDFEFIPFTFKKQELDTLLVECNYQDKFVDREANNFDHKILDHCELNTTLGIVRENVTPKLQNVIITHMGISSCDAVECVEEIKKIVPENVNVDYARAGAEYDLERRM